MSPDQSQWWERFDADPAKAVNAMLWGVDRVPPWTRYDPSSVLAFLFGERPEATGVLDTVLCAWLETRIQQQGQAWIEDLEDGLDSALYQAFSLLPRLKLPKSASLLRSRYGEFESLAREISGESFDAMLVLRIALARTQTDRSLLGWWYRQSEVAADRLDDGRMEFALAGVCGMPRLQGGTEYDLPDDALAVMVRWGRRLGVGEEARFLAIWGRLAGRYPSSPDTWAERLSPLLHSNADRPFARWWAAAVGMDAPVVRTGERGKRYWGGAVLNGGVTDECLRQLKEAKGPVVDRILDRFLRRHQAYVDATGDGYDLGRAFHVVGKELLNRRSDLSLRLAECAVAYGANGAFSWGLAAEALLKQGRADLAEEKWRQAIQIYGRDSHLYLDLGRLMERQGRLPEAEALYRKGMAVDPKDRATINALADLLAKHDHLGEAETHFRRVLSVDAGNQIAAMGLAKVLAGQGRREAALDLLLDAMQKFDNCAFPNFLSKLYVDWGQWDKAAELYRDTVAAYPDDETCRAIFCNELILRNQGGRNNVEIAALLADLDRLAPSRAKGLRTKWKRKNGSKGGREQEGQQKDRDSLPETPWSVLSPVAVLLRAEFIRSPDFDNASLLLTKDEQGQDWCERLRHEAEEALEDMLVRHPRHPVVQLVALRRGKIAAAALPKAGTGGYAVDLALADHADDMDALRDLADRQKHVEAPLAWLALARRKDADAVERLLTWSADHPGESEGAAFAHLRQRLNERFSGDGFRRLSPERKATMAVGIVAEIADDLLVKALMLHVAEELAPPVFALAA